MVLKEKLQRIMNDPVLWIETFVQIPDKTGKVVPFKLNPQQKYLLRNMGKFNIVLKARQLGLSSVMFWQLITIRRQNHALLFGNAYHESDYVFTWSDGRPFSPDYLTKKFRKIIDKSERLDKRLHLHDLRVSCVSILMSKGIPIKDVQKWVGHADIQTTLNIYTRTTRKRQLATAQTMANVLF